MYAIQKMNINYMHILNQELLTKLICKVFKYTMWLYVNSRGAGDDKYFHVTVYEVVSLADVETSTQKHCVCVV